MKFISTRGQAEPADFLEVLLAGLAPDGGLYVPESVPQIDANTLEQWRKLSYADLACEVLSLYITDLPKPVLSDLCHKTYNADNFATDQIVPIKHLKEGSLSLVGLSEGPTLAFKDIAMQFLGNIFEYALTKANKEINILGATSGDTGSAAEYALKGKANIRVFMLSPYQRMSQFQRAQMYSLQDENIFNIAVRGVFDDCQDIVKSLAGDAKFKAQYHIGAVNSINFARIAAQIVYYFWAWLRVTEKSSDEVSFTVPSGNFGNILAGHYARQMGLPIRKLVLATNENNVLEEFFTTGVYKPRSSAETYETSSPSMDISKASNFERFVFDLLGRDANQVRELWSELKEKGQFDLSSRLSEFSEKYGFAAGVSSHKNRLQTIKKCYQEFDQVIDPHTADGVFVAQDLLEDDIPMLVLETALPVKFGDTIIEAIGKPAPVPKGLEDLITLKQKFDVLDCDVNTIKEYLIENIEQDSN